LKNHISNGDILKEQMKWIKWKD